MESDPPPTDADLLLGSLGDPEGFAVLFDRHARAVHRYVAARVRYADIDDVVSETFITAFRVRVRYDQSHDNARPWLLGIATNVIRHHRRSEGRRLKRLRAMIHADEPQADLADGVVGSLTDADESSQVARALAQIEEHYQEVLLLAADSGLTYDEIARALSIPIGTVRSRLSRGRQRLRELLDADGQHTTDANPVRPTTEGTHG